MPWTYTPWGYQVETDGDAGLPPVITPQDLSNLTQGRFGPSTVGVDAVLAGVSAAIRSACGWHVSPSLRCKATLSGGLRLLELPSMLVTDVESVKELGQELQPGAYEWSEAGVVRRCQWRSWPPGYGSVEIEYMSGIPSEMALDLSVIAAQIASNALAAPAGIRQESAGDVSITYNQTGSGVSGGVRLLDGDLAMLAPYMLQRGWS